MCSFEKNLILKTEDAEARCLRMHLHIDDVKPVETSKGVLERVLLRSEDTKHHNLVVKHFIIGAGGKVSFTDQNAEYQHYVISGCGNWGRQFVHSETAIFVPGNKTPTTIAKLGRRNFDW